MSKFSRFDYDATLRQHDSRIPRQTPIQYSQLYTPEEILVGRNRWKTRVHTVRWEEVKKAKRWGGLAPRTWQCGSSVSGWWGLPWVQAEPVIQQIEGWQLRGVKSVMQSYWKTLMLAILWAIWIEVNHRIFRDKSKEVSEIGEWVKLKVAWWVKISNKQCGIPLHMMANNIEEV